MLLSGKNPDEYEKLPDGPEGPATKLIGLYWMYGPRLMNKLSTRMDMTLSEEERAKLWIKKLEKKDDK